MEQLLQCQVCGYRKERKRYNFYLLKKDELICNPCMVQKNKEQEIKKESKAIKRSCLKCDSVFEAENRFVRLCYICKKSDNSREMWER